MVPSNSPAKSPVHLLRRPGLTFWILVGLLLGLLIGGLFPEAGVALRPVSKIFIRMIKMLVGPIIFSTLVVGLAGAGDRHIGRLLIKALSWFWLATAVALAVGLGAANLLQPGLGAVRSSGEAFKAPPSKPFYEQVVPESLFAALADNAILQIVFFSVLFAMALAAIGDKGKPVIEPLRGVAEAMFKVTEYVMWTAPIGVMAAMAAAIGSQGFGIIAQLAKLVGSLYAALVVFVVLLLLVVKLFTGIRIRTAVSALKEPLLLAFSTTSSESALPKAIAIMERLGVPPHIVRFVLPAGYSFNLDGSTLYLALAALFIAQATGMHMPAGTQLAMMATLLLASKGVAAVPRASLVVLASTCAGYGLDASWIATILGVDAVMDMARTTVNVLGNCMASVIVARWERVLPADAPILTGVLPDPEPPMPPMPAT